MNSSWRIRLRAATVSAAIAITLTLGCAAASARAADKTTTPVVLRMANGYTDLSYEPAVGYFVRRVRQLSHGTVRVVVYSDWGNTSFGFEQRIVRDVAGGKAELGWVGTRIFDTLDVRSFQALTAPMLIDSYPLEDAVIRSEVPAQMLKSLGRLKVRGLAVLADGLRKPIAVKRPLLGPADWGGITFAAFRSRSQADAIRALGARPSEAWSGALADGLGSGKIQGFEKNLGVYQITQLAKSAPYVTANVNLWPQTSALLANPKRLAALTSAQQGWLLKAADDAAARSTQLVDHDAQLVAPLCRSGARFANASQDDLAALEQAFAPVYTRFRENPQTALFLARIAQLKQATPAGPALTIPADCAAPTRTTSSVTNGGQMQGLGVLNGVYRLRWTEQELRAAGGTGDWPQKNSGVLTMTLRAGRFRLHFPTPPLCLGSYAVAGTIVTIKEGPGCQGVLSARWSLHNGQLRLRVLRNTDPGDKLLFGGKPWKKIG